MLPSLLGAGTVRGNRCHASCIQTPCVSQVVCASSLTQSRDCMHVCDQENVNAELYS